MHIAVDLGAESGRVIVGNLETFDVIHRFPSPAVRVAGTLHWDILAIFAEIKAGLRTAFKRYGTAIKSIGIDTWGVDYGLIDSQGRLLGNPFHYRDNRTDGVMEEIQAKVGKERIYSSTGIQFMSINTIYQLCDEVKNRAAVLSAADAFLTIPDLLNYWLSDVRANEFSNATTTQLYNPLSKDWDWELIAELGIPAGIFQKIVPPGTILGKLRDDLRLEVGGHKDLLVIAPGCHDTASAVAAVPLGSEKNYAYLVSGTWSLLGTELDKVFISEEGMRGNFTNEGSANGDFIFLKNITGLWILQECRKEWSSAETLLEYDEIVRQAGLVGDLGIYIDVDDTRFLKPGTVTNGMVNRIQAYCRETSQRIPKTPGEIAKVIFESLARCYAENLQTLQNITGRKADCLYIIGGGSQNELLCKLTASASGTPVSAGPVEATALGNILVQALACGDIASIEEGREIIRRSYPLSLFDPRPET